MPQLDISAYGTQMFWTLIIFAFMSLIIFNFVLPPILRTINKRADLIEKNNKQAIAINEEIESIRFKIAEMQEGIQEKVEAIVEQANIKIGEESKKNEIALKAIEAEMQEHSGKKIAEMHKQLRPKIESGISDLADQIYKKITNTEEGMPSSFGNNSKK